jgi:hypothetical protein
LLADERVPEKETSACEEEEFNGQVGEHKLVHCEDVKTSLGPSRIVRRADEGVREEWPVDGLSKEYCWLKECSFSKEGLSELRYQSGAPASLAWCRWLRQRMHAEENE